MGVANCKKKVFQNSGRSFGGDNLRVRWNSVPRWIDLFPSVLEEVMVRTRLCGELEVEVNGPRVLSIPFPRTTLREEVFIVPGKGGGGGGD